MEELVDDDQDIYKSIKRKMKILTKDAKQSSRQIKDAKMRHTKKSLKTIKDTKYRSLIKKPHR